MLIISPSLSQISYPFFSSRGDTGRRILGGGKGDDGILLVIDRQLRLGTMWTVERRVVLEELLNTRSES
jgi:hypothetical protein